MKGPSELIEQQLATLPTKPGVYLMHNLKGQVIYVGKAINLANRVRSYFHASAQENAKTRRLVAEIASLEWIITDSEVEALILEANLIKKYRPRFNVRLKDDKRYPYLKITPEDFPKVLITRRMEQDGGRYFGPYTSTGALRETLDLLRRLFPYRTCDREITGTDAKPCLYFDLKLCLGPCIGAVDRTEYLTMLAQLTEFMEGRTENVMRDLERQIREAAEALHFERAARVRDRLLALRQVTERQKIVTTAALNQDVIALARDENNACVEVFFVRNGKLLGREYFVMEGGAGADDNEIMTAFLQQFYANAATIPPEILLPAQVAEAAVLQDWLRTQRGDVVYLNVPHEGAARELLDLAATNATETLTMLKAQWEADKHRNELALQELQTALGLPRAPVRIECYDISTTQGVEVVGSMVVFEHGVAKKSDYRRFKIKTVTGQDDFASMREVLMRRFDRWRRVSSGELKGTRGSQGWGKLPDLVVVDGGKGQLGVAVEVLQAFELQDQVPVVGLAKRHEELFKPGESHSLVLEPTDPAILLLRRIRDEAHRFAITYHRQRRQKRGLASQLDEIPGIGPVKRRGLLSHFGSLAAIQSASIEELTQVRGISTTLATVIQQYFEKLRQEDEAEL
ncbi:MAG TPA: excinuclease ABC subunit UvrC [Anaerolineae bacterium]|nr:excinuclease ABC subunit UvrC [Anaerolineae bacterium]HQE99387.1 excinuclease ABC subunit UvrC [Anaerolineae bacterium]HQJ11932.1 excinuclease ABC subunit UvrC [Anaerolineae bacterium]HUM36424.1 excinuclease ABC subunit UvrC [Anaerolineae bacterium]